MQEGVLLVSNPYAGVGDIGQEIFYLNHVGEADDTSPSGLMLSPDNFPEQESVWVWRCGLPHFWMLFFSAMLSHPFTLCCFAAGTFSRSTINSNHHLPLGISKILLLLLCVPPSPYFPPSLSQCHCDALLIASSCWYCIANASTPI